MKLTLSFLLLLPTLTSAFFQFARSDDGGLIFNNATLGERSFERQSSRRRKIPGLTVYRNRNTEKEDCKTYRIYYNMDEYQRKLDFVKPARNGPEIGATGESIRSFDVRTGRLVGDASFSVVFVGEFDCVVSTVLSFEKEFGIARSQLFLQGESFMSHESILFSKQGHLLKRFGL